VGILQTPRASTRRVIAIGLAVIAATSVVSAHAAVAAPVRKPVVLIYGDSLVWESAKFIAKGINGKVWTRHVFAVPTTAPCDWLQRLPGDIAKYHPTAVVLATEGNSNSPCMDDVDGVPLAYNSPAYLAKYRSDLSAFFSAAHASTVLFLEGAPIGRDADWNAAVTSVYGIAESLAPSYSNVAVSDAANRSVSNDGVYAQTLPCLPTEVKPKKDGCAAGQIDVRTDIGLQVGIHLCPIGITYPGTHPCATYANGKWTNVYSSGEVRYGDAIAAATDAALPQPARPSSRR
jgi:hypothetical protein